MNKINTATAHFFCSSCLQKKGGKTNERHKGNACPPSGNRMLSDILRYGRTIGIIQSY